MAKHHDSQCTPNDLKLDRSADLAFSIPLEEASGADKVDAAALSVAVEEDLGAVEVYDEYGDWKRSYADSVGMPLREKIR